MKTNEISTREAFNDLIKAGDRLTIFGNQKAKYDKIIRFFVDNDYKVKKHSKSMSDLANKLGFTPKTFRKTLLELHKLLLAYGLEYNMKNVAYQIIVNDDNDEVNIWLDSFPVLPRVGDTVEMRIWEHLFDGKNIFKVRNILHDLTEEEQNIVIWLDNSSFVQGSIDTPQADV